MKLIDQNSKTNWKFIAIVVVLGLVVAAILGLQYLRGKYEFRDPHEAQIIERQKQEQERKIRELNRNDKTPQSEKIIKTVSFKNSRGEQKRLIITFSELVGYNLYISNDDSRQELGTKAITLDFVDIGDSPFISSGDKKYIIVERVGPGDTQNLILIDENGKLVGDTLDSNQYPQLSGYLVRFESWADENRFWAKGVSYGEDPPPLQILIDTSTGKIIKIVVSR